MRKKIVVIGGGTGTFAVLNGLKNYDVDLSAIVSMADDGGSTGILRGELGVLPPGDVRQCLVALSSSDKLMNDLMNHRFENGSLKGHSFGNILLSALEQVTGSFDIAVEKASEILNIKGQVIPVTLEKITLIAEFENGKVLMGEHLIDTGNMDGLSRLYLEPTPKANPKAVDAVLNADLVIIGPGDIYSSILPVLLVPDLLNAIQNTKAPKMLVCNLMNKHGHTGGFSVADFSEKIENYLKNSLDFVVFNTAKPPKELVDIYEKDEEKEIVQIDLDKISKKSQKTKFLGGDLLSVKIAHKQGGDALKRSIIRHNPQKLAEVILSVL